MQDNSQNLSIYMCKICKKIFHNFQALQNHGNWEHVVDDVSCKENQSMLSFYNEIFNSGFDFISSVTSGTSTGSVHDGQTTRMFHEDHTYSVASKQGHADKVVKSKKVSGAIVTETGTYICKLPRIQSPSEQCREIFINCCKFSLHRRDDHRKQGNQAFRCHLCKKRLEEEGILTKMHSVELLVTRDILLTSSLSNDTRQIIAKTKLHKCQMCPKRFMKKGLLLQHMKTHNGIKSKYVTALSHNSILKLKDERDDDNVQHQLPTTSIEQFECDKCWERFKHSCDLIDHMKIHKECDRESNARFGETENRSDSGSFTNFHLYYGDILCSQDTWPSLLELNSQDGFEDQSDSNNISLITPADRLASFCNKL